MSDQAPQRTPSTAEVREHLHTIARLLRAVPHLGPEAQQQLAELVDELSRALEGETVPLAELTHLADHVEQLVKATREGEETGPIGKVRDRLEAAVATVEAKAPLLAG